MMAELPSLGMMNKKHCHAHVESLHTTEMSYLAATRVACVKLQAGSFQVVADHFHRTS